jgi:hypothetical protein
MLTGGSDGEVCQELANKVKVLLSRVGGSVMFTRMMG